MNSQKKITYLGFSLVEFIVVITIFSIMSSVSLFNYNEYQSRIRETNVAQDIALSIRQAQVYGISGSGNVIGQQDLDQSGVADDVFGDVIPDNPYITDQIVDITQDRSVRGVSIDPTANSLTIFEDVTRNFVYDASGPEEDIVIDKRIIQISDVEIMGVDLCASEPNCDNVEDTGQIDIVFQRPYPDAFISYDGDSNDTYNVASIIISSGGATQSYVEVNSIGNISAKKNYEVSQ